MLVNLKDLKLIEEKNYSKIVPKTWFPSDYDQHVEESILAVPFEPDLFQKQAFYFLSQNKSVFVSAHTSSGKTLVAEYAIRLAMQKKVRIIYTSPIKALSNQKYYEFKNKFDDVGIITGDVQINPTASCLIMTTEILRNMFYKDSDIIRATDFVVFDEVHYINDADRGVVWEESIIILPKRITLIMLSATIPNTVEFSDWVGRIKERNIYVISTTKRVVPLEFLLYLNFNVYSIQKYIKLEKPQISNFTKKPVEYQKLVNPRHKPYKVVDLGRFIVLHKLTPAIFFVFSRRQCEKYASSLINLDLTSAKEKELISKFFSSSLQSLSLEDRDLPQVKEIERQLLRGVAFHHGALLPCIKEIIEILFSQNMIKILVATETFSMGVNMPARCCVFLSLTKATGHSETRLLKSSEFIQMSGRAGRRGMDNVGTVIIADNNITDIKTIESVINGRSLDLISKFKLSYSLILMSKVAGLSVERLLKDSFQENHIQKNVSTDLVKLEKLEANNILVKCNKCSNVTEYLHHLNFISINNYKLIERIFRIGDIVITKNNQIFKITKYYGLLLGGEAYDGVIDFMNLYSKHVTPEISDVCKFLKKEHLKYSKFPLSYICKEQQQKKVTFEISEILFLVIDNKISFRYDLFLIEDALMMSKLAQSFRYIASYHPTDESCFLNHYCLSVKQKVVEEEINLIKKRSSVESLTLINEYLNRTKYLISNNFLDIKKSITLKGRVASEIKTLNEVFVTDLMFNKYFSSLDCKYILPLLSAFICEFVSDVPEIPEQLKFEVDKFEEKYNEYLKENRAFDIEDNRFLNFSLAPAVLDWINKSCLRSIVETYGCSEGVFVKLVIRLEEFSREMIEASIAMGSADLEKIFIQVSESIKNNTSVVFMQSLYID